MPTSVSLNEVRMNLLTAADAFTYDVKLALELWLQTVDGLPCHAQSTPTAAASQLVQAALRQAPRPFVRGDPRNLAWQHTHLPHISAAMQACVNSQLVTIARRISILQSLARSQQQRGDAQMQARLQAEHILYTQVDILALFFRLILPVAALGRVMQLDGQHDARTQHRQQQQQRGLQQGDELVRKVARSLLQTTCVRSQQVQQLQRMDTLLASLGAPATVMHKDLHGLVYGAHHTLSHASIIWLILVSQLPADHKGTVHFLNQVHWTMLKVPQILSQPDYQMARQLLRYVLGNTKLVHQLPEEQQEQIMLSLVKFIGFSADEWKSVGMSDEEAQYLQGWTAADHSGAEADSQFPASTGSSPSNTGGRQTSASTECGASDGTDDLGDMNTLLRMMYGCTV